MHRRAPASMRGPPRRAWRTFSRHWRSTPRPRRPIARADVVVCINMVHIAAWSSTVGLVRAAARVLPPDGLLFLYGPYRRTAATRRRAMRRSMRTCAAATPNGACATSKPSPTSRSPPASRRRSSPRCPPTTSASTSAVARDALPLRPRGGRANSRFAQLRRAKLDEAIDVAAQIAPAPDGDARRTGGEQVLAVEQTQAGIPLASKAMEAMMPTPRPTST